MSYLLFVDESGHDHKVVPYEVRGGIALHDARLWRFVRAMQAAELSSFGGHLHQFGAEIKGMKLLRSRVFRWAAQAAPMSGEERRRLALAFLNKGAAQQSPTRAEFTAYGQACIFFVHEVFRLLAEYDAKLFASAMPRTITCPAVFQASEFLRKDHVFLFERYFYFMEERNDTGLIVMDETERVEDRSFLNRMHRYFTKTQPGRHRATRIVPVPFFVSSDMTYPVQAADVCIYVINWGFRLPSPGMNAPVRTEIAREFEAAVRRVQYEGDGHREGNVFRTYGIVYVPDPYESRP